MATSGYDNKLLDEALAVKAIKAIGPGNVQSESSVEAFNRSCVDYIRLWQRTHPETKRHKQQAPAMFIFCPDQLPDAVWPSAKQILAFGKTCSLKLGGSLYICNENFRQVYQTEVNFENESDALMVLDEKGLRGCAAVVLLPQQDAILVHSPNGDPNEVERTNLGRLINKPFSFDDLDDHLATFHIEAVATHKGECDVWAIASKRKLKDEAERQIQRSLSMYLRLTIGRYGAKIDREVDSRWDGRSDLRVLSYVSVEEWQQAILELKVLRPTGTPNALDWALQGIDQLVGYRTGVEKETVACYLCCYDARKTDEDMPQVDDAAAKSNIKHRRYFMKTPGCGL